MHADSASAPLPTRCCCPKLDFLHTDPPFSHVFCCFWSPPTFHSPQDVCTSSLIFIVGRQHHTHSSVSQSADSAPGDRSGLSPVWSHSIKEYVACHAKKSVLTVRAWQVARAWFFSTSQKEPACLETIKWSMLCVPFTRLLWKKRCRCCVSGCKAWKSSMQNLCCVRVASPANAAGYRSQPGLMLTPPGCGWRPG